MGAFKLKADLPQQTRNEIDRIQAISAGLRNASEVAFLTALDPYLHNEVVLLDETGLIVIAAGNDIPTGNAGFKPGALFIDKNDSNKAFYRNIGTSTSASWGRIFAYDRGEVVTTNSAGNQVGTLNTLSGKITSAALTTSAGVIQPFVITNDKITVDSDVSVILQNGTNTQGHPQLLEVTPGTGSVTYRVKNGSGSQAFNGTLVMKFKVENY